MAEYIERESVKAAIKKMFNESDMPYDWRSGVLDSIMIVEDYPAADVVPVRHGRWIVDDISGLIKCSECDNDAPLDTTGGGQWRSPFCHNCGTRMDAEEREKRIRKTYIDVGSCRGWIVEGGLDKDGDEK